MQQDHSVFPDSIYKETVLAPLFEGAKQHYVNPVRAINQAHLVMLGETRILDRAQCHRIAVALQNIDCGLHPRTAGTADDLRTLFECRGRSAAA